MKIIQPGLYRILLFLLFASAAPPAQANAPWNLVLTESEWLTPNIIRIPFKLTGTLITVRARIDTLEGNFFFDTGASGLVLNSRQFASGIGQLTTARYGGGVTGLVSVQGASRIDTFQLDNLLVVDAKAEMIDLSHIENSKKLDLVGLIGYQVFKDYEVLFDYASSLLMLVRTDRKGEPLEPIPGWEYKPLESFPVKMARHVATVELSFAAKTRRRFALDSGAEQNLLSVYSGKRFLKENFEIRRRYNLVGAGQKSIEVLGGVLHNARLDSIGL